MSRGAWFAIALGAASAGACSATDDGTIDVSWSVLINGAASTCAAVEAQSVEIVAERSSGREYSTVVSCTAGSASVNVPPGEYTLSVFALDADGARLTNGPGAAVTVESGRTLSVPNVRFEFAFGNVNVSWAITLNSAAATCAAVGAAGVEFIHRATSGKEYRDTFNCSDGSGTVALPAGGYTLFAYLLDANDDRLTDGPGAPLTVAAGQTTNVGVIEFAFTLGTVTFRVHMGSADVTGGNCNPTNPGNGAGVALEEISVIRVSSSQCILLSITGVTNENDQPVTESTCDPFLCQLETTVHTLSGLQDGQYLMAVFGHKGATSAQNAPICYVSDEMGFTISGGNTVNLGQIFAPFDTQFDTQNLCNATKPQD